MDKNYDAKSIEDKWYKFWLNNKYFDSKPDNREPYCILAPPPNISATNLHVGHALNSTFQDILIRFKKMQGYNTKWIFGEDHAGLSAECAFLKELNKQNQKKSDFTKNEFIGKMIEWQKDKKTNMITQFQKLGNSCDWSDIKFTMDDNFCREVKKAFVTLYNKDLIYKGRYIVNYCRKCQTAISDDEVEYSENKSKLYYIKYYYTTDSNKYFVIATTRPETILADVAIAYHPDDIRYNKTNISVLVPLVNKPINLIADTIVDKEFGSGLVKITPAHDKTDYDVGIRHKLPILQIIDKNGKMINTNMRYEGMTVAKCREEIVKDLETLNYIEKIVDYDNKINQCYKCNTVIEPYLSEQYFVRMEILAQKAIEVITTKQIKIIPDYQNKIYFEWMNNIRDWCISRQISWGHQIPIYTCTMCNNIMCVVEELGEFNCNKCNHNEFIQQKDVLDTWFSSWLWAFGVFNSQVEKDYYCPSAVLITGSDILFFWVARMIMANMEFENKIPFETVYLHGLVRDEKGRKMSKTLGNVIDPIEIIDTFSADILRFTLMMNTPPCQDIRIDKKNSFKTGRTFCTKLWNSVRYIILNIKKQYDIDNIIMSLEYNDEDIWILEKLQKLNNTYIDLLENYEFHTVIGKIYNFVWDNFCNCYLELIKTNIDNDNQQVVLLYIIENILRLLHPFIPFLTEELYSIIKPFIANRMNVQSLLDTKMKKCEIPFNIMSNKCKFNEFWDLIGVLRQYKSTNIDNKMIIVGVPHDYYSYINIRQAQISRLTKIDPTNIVYNITHNKGYSIQSSDNQKIDE